MSNKRASKRPSFFARVFRLRLPDEVISKNGRLIIDRNGTVRPNYQNKQMQEKMMEQFGLIDLDPVDTNTNGNLKA